MLLESKVLNFFHTNLDILKTQTVVKSHSLLPEGSKLSIFMFSACLFHFWHSLTLHNFMNSRSRDGLAAKGLFPSETVSEMAFLWLQAPETDDNRWPDSHGTTK